MSSNYVVEDPQSWAFMRMLHGKHVNPLHLLTMMVRKQNRRQLELMRRMCQAMDKIAVSSAILTRRQREKYRENKFQEGKHVFYLFDNKYCPADIGLLVDLKSREVIYQ